MAGIIRIEKKDYIIWPVFFVGIFQSFYNNENVMYMACASMILLIWMSNKRIILPSILGAYPYLSYILFMTIIGVAISQYESFIVIRDFVYETYAFVVMILGCLIYKMYKDKSLWKTVCLYQAVVSIITLLKGIVQVTSGSAFGVFRTSFSRDIISVSILLTILLVQRIIYREKTFEKKNDYLIIGIFLAQVILNFSRTALINIAIGFTVSLFVYVLNNRTSIKLVYNVLTLIITMTVLLGGFYAVVPEDVSSTLIMKFEKSFQEIDDQNDYDDVYDAMHDWRGYEIYCVKKQWSSYDVPEQILGKGNGTAIKVHFTPPYWGNIFVRQDHGKGIAVLHNTYYTILVKGGIVSIILLLWFFAKNIIVFTKLSRKKEIGLVCNSIVGISVVYLFDAYVFRSFFTTDIEFAIMMLYGWYNMKIMEKR